MLGAQGFLLLPLCMAGPEALEASGVASGVL